jgi:hypothetical protein
MPWRLARSSTNLALLDDEILAGARRGRPRKEPLVPGTERRSAAGPLVRVAPGLGRTFSWLHSGRSGRYGQSPAGVRAASWNGNTLPF